mmetsp:Transcript_43600/g.141504  ORF Transcript_43600/g.141504 Transcript_43600/m.141504 type:complete len:101 (-) Transcript_43600:2-304(-)
MFRRRSASGGTERRSMPAGSLRSSNTDRPRGGSLTVLTNIAPCLRPQLRRILGRRFQCNSSLIELQSPLLYNDMVVILSNELGKYGGGGPPPPPPPAPSR